MGYERVASWLEAGYKWVTSGLQVGYSKNKSCFEQHIKGGLSIEGCANQLRSWDHDENVIF